jgi:hypothetical protein
MRQAKNPAQVADAMAMRLIGRAQGAAAVLRVSRQKCHTH